MKDDSVYLKHILESIRRIEEDTASGHDAFRASRTLQDAVLRNLQVLSESCQRVSDEVKSAWPQIEWKRIAAFRNVIIVHERVLFNWGTSRWTMVQILSRSMTLEAILRSL